LRVKSMVLSAIRVMVASSSQEGLLAGLRDRLLRAIFYILSKS